MAQEVRWLDDRHFAVGRWDGSLSVFEFETAPSTGPLIAAAVSSPQIHDGAAGKPKAAVSGFAGIQRDPPIDQPADRD
jgi:hypothetical protein